MNAQSATWASAIAALIGALILWAQLATLRSQSKQAEVSILEELRAGWRMLRPEWRLALLRAGSLYVRLDAETKARFPATELALKEAEVFRSDFHDRMSDDAYTESERGAISSGLNPFDLLEQKLEVVRREKLGECYEPMGDLLRFLANVASLVFRGRLTPQIAYEALGPDLVRNSAAVRRILDEAAMSGYYVSYYPGIRELVRSLVDIMWAEASRRGDLDESEASRAVAVKVGRDGTGVMIRRRVRSHAARLGGARRAFVLDWHLLYSEVAPSRRGFQGLSRRVVSCVRGYLPWIGRKTS